MKEHSIFPKALGLEPQHQMVYHHIQDIHWGRGLIPLQRYSWCILMPQLTANHMRSHDSKQSQADFTRVFSQQPPGNSFHFCDKECGSAADLKMYGVNVSTSDKSFACHIYSKSCKWEIGLRSQLLFVGSKRWKSLYIYIRINLFKDFYIEGQSTNPVFPQSWRKYHGDQLKTWLRTVNQDM